MNTNARSIFALFTLAICLGGVSCNSTKAPDDKAFDKTAPAVAGNDDMPVPPKDAQFTIYCLQFNGPNHMAEARQAKLLLGENAPMKKKWYIVHGSDQSTLYYGFYRTFNSSDTGDADEAKRALADLNAIRVIQDSQGGRPFSASLPVPIDAPDPQVNPAWDLTKANGYWSVEVGAYTGAGRKEAAVDSVREARKRGIEAYYFHGDTTSSVCIGAWPAEAATVTDVESQNVDPNTPLLVTPDAIPDETKKQLGSGIQTAATHVDYADPTLREALSTWEHDVNGQAIMKAGIDPVTRQQVQVREKAFLVKIPHPDGTPAMADTNTSLPPDDVLINPVAPTPGAGQLRSLDGR